MGANGVLKLFCWCSWIFHDFIHNVGHCVTKVPTRNVERKSVPEQICVIRFQNEFHVKRVPNKMPGESKVNNAGLCLYPHRICVYILSPTKASQSGLADFFQIYAFRFSCLNEFGQLVDIEKSAFVTCGASTHLPWTMFRKSFFVWPYRTNWMRKRILNKLSWNAALCSVIDAFVPSFTHDHSHDPFVRSSLISKWSLSWCIHRERSWSIMSLHDAPWALMMHRQYSWFVLGHP